VISGSIPAGDCACLPQSYVASIDSTGIIPNRFLDADYQLMFSLCIEASSICATGGNPSNKVIILKNIFLFKVKAARFPT
jgi:hypothetical protein